MCYFIFSGCFGVTKVTKRWLLCRRGVGWGLRVSRPSTTHHRANTLRSWCVELTWRASNQQCRTCRWRECLKRRLRVRPLADNCQCCHTCTEASRQLLVAESACSRPSTIRDGATEFHCVHWAGCDRGFIRRPARRRPRCTVGRNGASSATSTPPTESCQQMAVQRSHWSQADATTTRAAVARLSTRDRPSCLQACLSHSKPAHQQFSYRTLRESFASRRHRLQAAMENC